MLILFYIILFSGTIQLLYYFILSFGILKYTPKIKSTNNKTSIIICAKNEAQNLFQNLPFIIQQNHFCFEIIVVDDNSTDNTKEIIEQLQQTNSNLFYIKIGDEKIGLGKKFALQKGVEFAKYDTILLTDADCIPISKNWIQLMSEKINDNTKIVLGISPYTNKKHFFLFDFIQYETFFTAFQYIGFASIGLPYMGVGRNIAYDKKYFLSHYFTQKNYAIKSGDDDLKVNAIANKKNTVFILDINAQTISESKNNFKDYFYQKTRHLSTGIQYKKNIFFILFIFGCSKFLFYTFSVFYILFQKWNVFIVFFVLINLIIISIVNYIINKKLQVSKSIYFSIFYDFLLSIFLPIVSLFSFIFKEKKWK